MKFTTVSGSSYEIDLKEKKVRRLNGRIDPQPRQGKDGEWKKYLEVLGPTVGRPVVIFWDPKDVPRFPDSPPEAHPSTVTSFVVSVDE